MKLLKWLQRWLCLGIPKWVVECKLTPDGIKGNLWTVQVNEPGDPSADPPVPASCTLKYEWWVGLTKTDVDQDFVDTLLPCGDDPDFEITTVCKPGTPFTYNPNTTADCDPGDAEPGDPYSYTWTPIVPAGATACYPSYVVDNGDGSFTINGEIAANGDIVFPDGGGPDGVHNIMGVLFYNGRCYDLPTDICSGGDVAIAVIPIEYFTAKVTFVDGDCVIIDPATGLPVPDARLCRPGESSAPLTLADAKAKLEEDKPCITNPTPYKQKFLYFGLENTGVRFDNAITLELPNADGSVTTVDIPATNSYPEQLIAWEAAFNAAYPDACEVAPRWWEWRPAQLPNTGGGGLAPSDMNFPAAVGRFMQWTVCPGDDASLPLGATITKSEPNTKLVGKQLISEVGESPVENIIVCIGCDGCGDEIPKCAIPAGDDFPETPEPLCTFDTLPGPWCDITTAAEPEDDDVENANGIFVIVTTCGTEQDIEFYELTDGALETYTPVGSIVNCDTLVGPEPEAPVCPPGLPRQCVVTPGRSYGILDNSNWVNGAPAPFPHLKNGTIKTITVTHADGSTTLVPITNPAPYFNSFMADLPTATGGACFVLPVCANHSSPPPKGCHPTHVANLNSYPAYTPGTGVSNDTSNPALAELWATGWMIDCDGCSSPIVRAEITEVIDPANPDHAAWLGVAKDIITYVMPETKLWQYFDCETGDYYYFDCDTGEPVPAPTCKPEPCAAAPAEDPTVIDCPCGGGAGAPVSWTDDDNTTDQSFGIGDVDADNPGEGVKYDTANANLPSGLLMVHEAIRACIAAGSVASITITDSEGNTSQIDANHDASVLDANGDVQQYAYEGTVVDGDPASGKITAMAVVCSGGEAGKCRAVHDACAAEAAAAALEVQNQILEKLCVLADALCVKAQADISQRAAVHPTAVLTYGPHVGNGIDAFTAVMENNGYTVTLTPVLNAEGQEIGDLRRICITGPEEHPLSITNVAAIFNIGDVPLTYRRVNCPDICQKVELP